MNTSSTSRMLPGRSGNRQRRGGLSCYTPLRVNAQPAVASAMGQTLQNTMGYVLTPKVLELTLAGGASNSQDTDETDDWFSLDITNFGGRPIGLADNYLWSSCYEPIQPSDGKKFRDQLYSISPGKIEFQPAAKRTSKAEIIQSQVLQYFCNVEKKNYSYFITLNKTGELKAFNLDNNRKLDQKVPLPLVIQDPLVHSYTEFDIDYKNKSIYVLGKSAQNHVRDIVVFPFPPKWEQMAIYEISTSHDFKITSLKNGNCFVQPKPDKIIITSIKTILGKATQVQSRGNRWRIDILPRSQINFNEEISNVKEMINMNTTMMYCQSGNSIRFYDTSTSDDYDAPPIYTFQGRQGKLGDINSKVTPLPDGSSRVIISHQPTHSHILVTFKKESNKIVGVESNPFNGLMTLPTDVKNNQGRIIKKRKTEFQFSFLAMAVEEDTGLLAVLFGYKDLFTVKMYNPRTFALVKEFPIIERVCSKACDLKDIRKASITVNSDVMLVEFNFHTGLDADDEDEDSEEFIVREYLCSRLISTI